MIQWKTVLASAQQSSVCIYLSRRWETIKTKMIAHFEMQHRDIMRLQLLQEQNQTKWCFFFINGSLFYSLTPKKRPSFSINEAGNWVRGPAGYGLTTTARGPNLALSLRRSCTEEFLIRGLGRPPLLLLSFLHHLPPSNSPVHSSS